MGLQSVFRESFNSEGDFKAHIANHFIRTADKNNSVEAGMHRPEGGKSPHPPYKSHPVYIYIYRERERERESFLEPGSMTTLARFCQHCTVWLHINYIYIYIFIGVCRSDNSIKYCPTKPKCSNYANTETEKNAFKMFTSASQTSCG